MREIYVGARTVSQVDAERWIVEYFDEASNRTTNKPYAYPAYDALDTGSSPNELNDGDLLAPTLLNAAPTIAAFYSLQSARGRLQEALGQIDPELTLAEAVANSTVDRLLGNLVAVLDDRRLYGVRLTTLLKVLHRKRPKFVPLYDRFVKMCYVGSTVSHPVTYRRSVPTATYALDVARAICNDIESQAVEFRRLSDIAPGIPPLRLIDVLAWKLGRN